MSEVPVRTSIAPPRPADILAGCRPAAPRSSRPPAPRPDTPPLTAEHELKAVHHDERERSAQRDREHPRCQDVSGDAPPHGGDALARTDAHDAGVDAVRGRYRDPEVTGAEDRDGAGGLRGEALERRDADDLRSHRLDDLLATRHRAECDRRSARDDDP